MQNLQKWHIYIYRQEGYQSINMRISGQISISVISVVALVLWHEELGYHAGTLSRHFAWLADVWPECSKTVQRWCWWHPSGRHNLSSHEYRECWQISQCYCHKSQTCSDGAHGRDTFFDAKSANMANRTENLQNEWQASGVLENAARKRLELYGTKSEWLACG